MPHGPHAEWGYNDHREGATHFNSFLDRLGGAKADRRKEAAISTAVETYLRNHQSERADGRMSRGKMVLFFKFCFPLFLEIVLKVIRQESTKGKIPSFKNDSVFSNSSKIPYIETTDHWWRYWVVTWPLVTNTLLACQDPYRNDLKVSCSTTFA